MIIARDTIERVLDIICAYESNFNNYIFSKLGRINAEHYAKKNDIENSHNNLFFSQFLSFSNLKNGN